jgi:hypothetical protein
MDVIFPAAASRHGLMHGYFGQSVGKMLTRVKVVDLPKHRLACAKRS